MYHDRVHPHLAHQHDITGKFSHCGIITHGVATKFYHNDGPNIPLQIGQRLGQGSGGGDWVTHHGKLLFHLGSRGRVDAALLAALIRPAKPDLKQTACSPAQSG